MNIPLMFDGMQCEWIFENDPTNRFCDSILRGIYPDLERSRPAVLRVSIQPIGKCVKVRLERSSGLGWWRWRILNPELAHLNPVQDNVFLVDDDWITVNLVKMYRRYQSGLKDLTMAEVFVRVTQ